MNLVATSIAGVFVVETAVFRDHRGDFKRLFCSDELGAVFGPKRVVQINHSLTTKKGAIRGLHYQFGPYSEMKMIQCLRGRIWDVAIDLRRDSATFLHWFGTELGPELNRALVIPEGCAHGFQVLQRDSELLYFHTALYSRQHEAGVRFDDPLLSISWPLAVTDLSSKDACLPTIGDDFQGVPS